MSAFAIQYRKVGYHCVPARFAVAPKEGDTRPYLPLKFLYRDTYTLDPSAKRWPIVHHGEKAPVTLLPKDFRIEPRAEVCSWEDRLPEEKVKCLEVAIADFVGSEAERMVAFIQDNCDSLEEVSLCITSSSVEELADLWHNIKYGYELNAELERAISFRVTPSCVRIIQALKACKALRSLSLILIVCENWEDPDGEARSILEAVADVIGGSQLETLDIEIGSEVSRRGPLLELGSSKDRIHQALQACPSLTSVTLSGYLKPTLPQEESPHP